MGRAVVVAGAIVALLVVAHPVHAQRAEDADTSTVTFIHGIRGFLADVYLDDELILAGFAPERITDPLTLDAGRHRIDLREADAPADAEPVVTKTFTVPAGGRMTAIAHWTGVEACTITLFDDAGDVVAAGSGRLIARHAAATGAVRLAVDDGAIARLRPMMEYVEAVDPGPHTIAIDDSSSSRTVVESSRVPVPEGSARVVYLVGSAKDSTLGLLTQTVHGLGSNPTGVPTGNSGLADANGTALPVLVTAALLLAVLLPRRRTVAMRR